MGYVESLEPRQLLHAEFSAAINFQPANVPKAPGMLIDYGSPFDYRRGGYQYGWNTDLSANLVDRNLVTVQRNDTFIVMPSGSKFEITVPEDGEYEVYLVSGDPGQVNERMGLLVEGQVAIAGITRRDKPWLEAKVNVEVTDGKLTIEGAPWVSTNKLNYISVRTSHGSAKSVGVTATDPSADEASGAIGTFTVSRTGDLTDELTVPLFIQGSATNTVDYGRIGPRVTFAKGVASINLKVAPIADTLDETNETVTLSLGSVVGYQPSQVSATVTIVDTPTDPNPTPSGTLSWTTGTAHPQGKAEAFGGAIGSKLYVFGGFIDNTFKPTTGAHVFNPATGTWSAIASLPQGLTHAATAFDSRYMYFAGGYPATANGQTFSTNKVYRYDSVTNTYTALPNLPQARGAAAAGIVNGVLYVHGGADSTRKDRSEMWALDLSNTGAGWIQKASLPESRNHHASIGLGSFLHVLGGQTGQDTAAVYKATHWRYNPGTNTWQTLASLPSARSHVTNAIMIQNGQIITVGGEGVAQAKLRNVDRYNPATNTWTAQTSLPAPRFSSVGDLINGKIYFSGGFNSTFEKTTYVGTFA